MHRSLNVKRYQGDLGENLVQGPEPGRYGRTWTLRTSSEEEEEAASSARPRVETQDQEERTSTRTSASKRLVFRGVAVVVVRRPGARRASSLEAAYDSRNVFEERFIRLFTLNIRYFT